MGIYYTPITHSTLKGKIIGGIDPPPIFIEQKKLDWDIKVQRGFEYDVLQKNCKNSHSMGPKKVKEGIQTINPVHLNNFN